MECSHLGKKGGSVGKKETEEKDERRARKREKGRSLNTREDGSSKGQWGGSKMKKEGENGVFSREKGD